MFGLQKFRGVSHQLHLLDEVAAFYAGGRQNINPEKFRDYIGLGY